MRFLYPVYLIDRVEITAHHSTFDETTERGEGPRLTMRTVIDTIFPIMPHSTYTAIIISVYICSAVISGGTG